MTTPLQLVLFNYDVPVIDKFRDMHACLSNYFYYQVNSCGWVCPTNEHGFVLAKCATPWDKKRVTDAMVRGSSPGAVKRMGRHVELRKEWDDIKVPVMTSLIDQKFAEGSALSKRLIATYPAHLLEGNTWHDQYWGDCNCLRVECIEPGQNWLGKLLMVRRAQLLHIL